MTARRLTLATLVSLCALSAALVVLAAPALAARGHELSGSFGEPGSGPGQLKAPSAVAVNEATGDVYVLDEGNGRVERFSAAGVFLGEFNGSAALTGAFSFTGEPQSSGIAVDNSGKAEDPSNGDVYVIDHGHGVIDKFNASDEYLGQLSEANGKAFGELEGVTVDRSGGVWVLQEGASIYAGIESFDDALANAFKEEVAFIKPRGAGFLSPGLAIDGEGDFYLRSRKEGSFHIEKLSHSGQGLIERLDDEDASAVATDQLSGDSFVDNLSSVAAFRASGAELERLAVPGEHGAGLAVHASASGLGGETLYVADFQANVVDVYGPQLPAAPSVEGESLSEVSGESASFRAQVNPRGAATTYRFEYGACTTPSTCSSSPYGHSVPVPDGVVGSDFEIHNVSAHVQGLSAHTSYHFRVSARNEAKGEANEVQGAAETFITQALGGELKLPDSRQWELVSPVDKLGSLILPIEETGVVQASSLGDAISYIANAPIEAVPPGTEEVAQILSTRGGGGWSSQNLTTPHDGASGVAIGSGKEVRFFSEDLSAAFVQPFGAFTPSISPEASEQTAFQRTDFFGGNPSEHCLPAVMHCYRPLVTGAAGVANVRAGTVFGLHTGKCPGENVICSLTEFEDATPDGSFAVLRSGVALTKASIEGSGLYEWSAATPAAEQLRLISVLPPNQAGEELPAKEALLGQHDLNTRGAISEDGGQVVWEEANETGATPGLYLRDVPRRETIELDKAEACGGCESGGGRFQLASSDGSRVLFTDAKRLTSKSGAAGKPDLYQCEIVEGAGGKPECRLTDLTPANGPESADVLGSLPGASTDAQWVYFVANGVLSGEADSNGEHAKVGQCTSLPPPGATCNLYVLHEGQLRLVSVLAAKDANDWAQLREMPARVSENGQWLAFMSGRSLTGYDNRDAKSGAPVAEVYLYSTATDSVVCASCEPSGERPSGIEYNKLEPGSGGLVGGPRETWEGAALVAANVPGWTGDAEGGSVSRHQPRYLTDEGRLFFDSADSLVPQDVNGTQDVYQYEPQGIAEPAGVNGCTSASQGFVESAAGCVNLVSSGESSQESAFLDASQSGGDVFFLTSAKLLLKDKDAAYDVYDAHECTAESPCPPEEATVPPPCETADSCKPAPTPQPEIFGAPASALFSGAGNGVPSLPSSTQKSKVKAKSVKCKKGFVKKKGKCVRKPKSKSANRKGRK